MGGKMQCRNCDAVPATNVESRWDLSFLKTPVQFVDAIEAVPA